MAYETNKKPTMSVILKSQAISELGKSLELTQEQLAKAKSSALALSSNPTLKNCEPFSLVKYCYEMARYNFSRDDCAYPVPYGNSVQAQVGYKGFREIAMRSGKYNEINASPVYSCDKVKRDRLTGKIVVEFEEDINAIENADIVGYYAYALGKDNTLLNSFYMSVSALEEHGKKYSKSYNSIWGDKKFGFPKMAMKTVIKQLCSQLDNTPQLDALKKVDQIVFGGENQSNEYLDNPMNKNKTFVDIEPIEKEELVIEEDTTEEPF